jgi:hypothetical protein
MKLQSVYKIYVLLDLMMKKLKKEKKRRDSEAPRQDRTADP